MVDSLGMLEKKVVDLIDIIKNLSHNYKLLSTQNELLLQEIETLKIENAQFSEKIAQQVALLQIVEAEGVRKEHFQLTEREKEKNLAKVVVDDLIKSIDALIEYESQQ